MDALDAQLVAERARREAAERRDQTLQGQITHEAQSQQELKRERDRALGEIDALKAQLDDASRGRAELDARAVAMTQHRNLTETLQSTLDEQKQRAGREKALLEKELADLKAERDRLAMFANKLPAGDTRGDGDPGLRSHPAGLGDETAWTRLRRAASAILLVTAIWEALATLTRTFFAPHIPDIVSAFVPHSFFLPALLTTLKPVCIGFIAGAGLAVLIRSVTSISPLLHEFYTIVRITARRIPMPSLIMVAVLWFGFGEAGHGVVAGVAAFAAFTQIQGDGGMNFGSLSALNRFQSAFQAALIWCVSAEVFASKEGIGHILGQSGAEFDMKSLAAATIVLICVSVSADSLLALIWRRSALRKAST
jgi:ABC-type nitrate/sulfonate/bicarbonate transport system permease component